jgi:hypothetical protein
MSVVREEDSCTVVKHVIRLPHPRSPSSAINVDLIGGERCKRKRAVVLMNV